MVPAPITAAFLITIVPPPKPGYSKNIDRQDEQVEEDF
jgi:hypothetical protein